MNFERDIGKFYKLSLKIHGKAKKRLIGHPPRQRPPVVDSAPLALKRWMMIVLACVGFVIYGHSLRAPFILDDAHKIEMNPDLRVERLPEVFSRLVYPYAETYTFDRNDPSRPVTFLTYTLNYYFGKVNPFGYRLVNLLGHIGVSLLLLLQVPRGY